MARPPEDARAPAIRLGWVQHAVIWSRAARGLLGGDVAEVELGLVASFLALQYANRLVTGTPTVYEDQMARGDCPVDPRKVLRAYLDRLSLLRNAVLHMADYELTEHRYVKISWKADPPSVVLTATVGASIIREDTISRSEIEELLDQLDPWLQRHFERLLDAVPRLGQR